MPKCSSGCERTARPLGASSSAQEYKDLAGCPGAHSDTPVKSRGSVNAHPVVRFEQEHTPGKHQAAVRPEAQVLQ